MAVTPRSETDVCNLGLAYAGIRNLISSLDDASPEAQFASVYYPIRRDMALEECFVPWNTRRATLIALGGVTWSSVSTYNVQDSVNFNSQVYISLVGANLNNQPDISPTFWQKVSRYAWGNVYIPPTDMMVARSIWPSLPPIAPSVSPLLPWARIQRSDQRIPFTIESDSILGKVLLCDQPAPELHYTAALTDVTKFPSSFINAIAWGLAASFTASLLAKRELADAFEKKYEAALNRSIMLALRETQEDAQPDSEFIAIRKGGATSDTSNPVTGINSPFGIP